MSERPRKHLMKRVCWDGPHPRPGEFLASRTANLIWLIQTVQVHRAVDASGAGLSLGLLRQTNPLPLPRGAVLHPASRVQASDPTGPARTRQIIGSGPTAVMKDKWRDPSDTTPNASHRPREITGYRRYCPLRRMMMSKGSQITTAHIMAADQFRTQADLAMIGCGGARDGEPNHQGFGPHAGPSHGAILQAMSSGAIKAALARFATAHQPMLLEIVLNNRSLHAWCALLEARTGRHPEQNVEMGRLLTILDILADHYDVVIKADLAVGAILEPA